MKNQRNGQAEILHPDQVAIVLAELSPKMRAVFAICYFTACRVSEALSLTAAAVLGGKISFRRVDEDESLARGADLAGSGGHSQRLPIANQRQTIWSVAAGGG